MAGRGRFEACVAALVIVLESVPADAEKLDLAGGLNAAPPLGYEVAVVVEDVTTTWVVVATVPNSG